MRFESHFMGRSSFFWFVGVVEDRFDPLKLGRVRVRILGAHTESKSDVPTEELHWAYVVMPITSGSVNGIGQSPTGLLPGSWVYGFFRDGEAAQDPVVMFTMGGIPQDPANPHFGFSDPRNNPALDELLESAPRKIQQRTYPNDGSGAQLVEETIGSTYPRTTNPFGCIVGEPDTNRLARNESITDTIVQVKTDQRDLLVPVALDADVPWDEPITPYNAQYPYNHVYESESGHITEVDDTPNNERLHRYHRTGTFEEIGPDGSRVVKVVMDNYTVILRDNLCHVQGTCNITVDGNANLYVGHNANIEVNNDTNVVTKGNLSATTFGTASVVTVGDVSVWNQSNCNITTEADTNILSKGNTHVTTVADTIIQTQGDTNVQTSGNTTIVSDGAATIASNGDMSLSTQGAMKITSAGDMTLKAANIHLNP